MVTLTQAPKQTAQIITTDNDTLLGVVRIPELLSPVLVADDTTEYTLIIAEENKGHKTASRDSHLKGFAPSIPRTHDEFGLGIKITD